MWSIVLLISISVLVQGLSWVDPLVSTRSGLIRGLRINGAYAQFLGVPYAEVDKSNPFGPAFSHPGFDDVFKAYESNMCPQVSNNVSVGTINCLTLNIYVPDAAASQNSLPVMVWIHGGYFVIGSGDSIGVPEYLLVDDIIVVSINYRLGIYGFMCLDIPEVSGNQGLRDQVLALRWIGENIDAFGGDPRKVTIFGESAGGMSINLHLLSSYETLFQRAIIQSGPAVSPWVMQESDNTVPIKLSKALDFATDDITEAINFLANVHPNTLVKMAHDLKLTSYVTLEDSPATLPCIENKMEGVEHFITAHTLNIGTSQLKNIPVIIGVNSNEMAMGFVNAKKDFFKHYDFNIINSVLDLKEKCAEAIRDIRHFYIGDEDTGDKVKEEIQNFSSDVLFNYPTEKMAEKLLKLGAKSVFRYVFSYSGERNIMKLRLKLNTTGAVHADELGYLFDNDELIGDTNPRDQLMIERMSMMWTNFAKYGDPTPTTSELLPIKWAPISKTTHRYLNMDTELTLQTRPFHDRMAFWDIFHKLYEQMNAERRTRKVIVHTIKYK